MDSVHKIKNNFINDYYKYFNSELDGVYRPKLDYFCSYLTYDFGLDIYDSLQTEKLLNLEFYHIEQSMMYYVINSKKSKNPKDHVLKASTLQNYFTVIKIFFRYLNKIGLSSQNVIDNIIRLELDREESRKFLEMNTSKLKLGGIEKIIAFNESEIDLILTEFQCCFHKVKELELEKLNQEYFELFFAGLGIMLTYYLGVKTSKISCIKVCDFSLNDKRITVNKITVPLHNDIIIPLNYYIKLRGNFESSDKLLVDLFTNEDINTTKYLMKFMRNLSIKTNNKFNKTDISGLIRYRINKYIDDKIPFVIIKHITGVTDSFLGKPEEGGAFENFLLINEYFKK